MVETSGLGAFPGSHLNDSLARTMHREIELRETTAKDMPAALAVIRDAFGGDEEARLVTALMHDPSAEPWLSLAAFAGDTLLGHILFSRAFVANARHTTPASILAPLAVATRAQGQGIGGGLIREGLERLASLDTTLVFVLGHPGYYTRYGFEPAVPLGFTAPYPIPDRVADAWMVQGLKSGVIGSLHGQVTCASALDRAEYWRE